ncbi:putative secreted protein (Por secretion system target) [Marinirhabdus gelatinilytica]|uniref:Putative secreted protein (Por secretion system target) n=2 Tax=Marinirhabdus gelatinilytica TaxID=1703343 RepID=A0A370QEU2_9FLAO|nr:putative secreted protein (Por secretion system target) [Marinirhabdus gelatinilytica]
MDQGNFITLLKYFVFKLYFCKAMKKLVLCLLLPGFLYSQSLEDLDFGTPETLDIVTWNIEFFPKNNQATIQYVVAIVEAMEADIVAIQEVDDYFAFNELVSYLDDYGAYRISTNNRGLAYLYRKDVVQINDGYELFTQLPEADNFPRFPMVLDIFYGGERVVLINNHFKCCGDGEIDPNDMWDEETRRFNASTLLKAYIDQNLDDVPVVLLGDLNDILTDPMQHNVFSAFLNDPDDFFFTDIDIAQGTEANWSYPSWPSHLDHILITDELFDLFNSTEGNVETLKIEDYLTGGWQEYDQNVSDHRPVALQLPIEEIVLQTDEFAIANSVFVYPNPFSERTIFKLPESFLETNIAIYNAQGQLVHATSVDAGAREYVWESSRHASGFYFAKVYAGTNEIATLKLVIQ